MLGRTAFAFFDDCSSNRKGLSFGQLRQGFLCAIFFRLCILHFGTVSVLQCFPSGVLHRFSFGGKLHTGTVGNHNGFRIDVGLGYGAQQTQGHQLQHRFFSRRKGRKVCILEISGRDYCVVVSYFLIVDDRLRITGNGDPFAKRHSIGNQIHQHRQAVCHITGQIAAVSTGIGAELLFIQALQIVQGLLGCKSKQAVGISLQSSQVIEGRRLFGLFLVLHLFDRDSCTLADFFQLLSSSLIRHALPGYGKTRQLQRHGIKGNRLKGFDLSFSLDNECQRWGHNAPDVECAMIQHGKKPCGIDPHQPVGLGTAEGSITKSVIVRTGAQVCKALPYGGVLHRRNPEPFHRLLTACQLIDAAEDQLALASGITGIYHLRHIRGIHQLFENIKLLFLILSHHHLPMLRQNRQVIISPLGVLGVIAVCIRKTGQMAHAPADTPAVAFQIPVLTGSCTDHRRQTLGNRWFFSNHQFILSHDASSSP